MILIPSLLAEVPKPPNYATDIISEPLTLNIKNKLPKEDYQKNIIINVIKCSIRMIVHLKHQKKIKKICARK
jgi:hypothetical protein